MHETAVEGKSSFHLGVWGTSHVNFPVSAQIERFYGVTKTRNKKPGHNPTMLMRHHKERAKFHFDHNACLVSIEVSRQTRGLAALETQN